jgi:hypothetical protein
VRVQKTFCIGGPHVSTANDQNFHIKSLRNENM